MSTFTDSAGTTLHNVHEAHDCKGPGCPIHKPTDHHMNDWPLVWRAERRIFERTCPHGLGHPDPDSLYVQAEFLDGPGDQGIHGCDGCCVG